MKVSVVMQSYLGEYPGSRKDSDVKFIRAVNSFINQTYKNSELIIVSDGCDITHKLYYEHFKANDRIKYVYVDKDTLNMYEVNGEKFYRGLPRQVGRTLVTGEITTYVDSDDIILPTHIENITNEWVKHNDISWLINLSWYENIDRVHNPIIEYDGDIEPPNMNEIITIDSLESEWVPFKNKMTETSIFVPLQPTTLTHLSDLDIKWEDTYGNSEDIKFNRELRLKFQKGEYYWTPTYVRCHYPNRWDY